MTTPSLKSRFLYYDGARIVGEYNASGVLQRRYVPGPGLDEPVVWYEGAGVSDRRWLIADERGSVIAITGAGGVAASINSYDEYGIPRAGNVGRFGFAGQAWLPEVALTHSRARAYAPSAGRFVQTDPIGVAGGMNLYAYVGNDPVNFSDPWGLCEVNSTVVDGVEEFTGTCPPPPDWSTPIASIADWLAQNGGVALLNRLEAQAALRVAGMETYNPLQPGGAVATNPSPSLGCPGFAPAFGSTFDIGRVDDSIMFQSQLVDPIQLNNESTSPGRFGPRTHPSYRSGRVGGATGRGGGVVVPAIGLTYFHISFWSAGASMPRHIRGDVVSGQTSVVRTGAGHAFVELMPSAEFSAPVRVTITPCGVPVG